ncbi:MAG: hypothetical protein QOG63_2880 [Thermoleophilaceae bacterium]|nr:hypothetical protein [Thermoleophilaceae bacterium]
MDALEVGSVFAGHRIDGVAGRGGMGVVYVVTHLRLQHRRALKVIAPEYSSDEGFRRRFERESRVAASIDNPHVLPIHDAGEEAGRLYVTMRYVDGIDLRKLIRSRGRLPAALAADIVGQNATALDAAHARALVHRDVKPANVLLAGDPDRPSAFLTDFGLTKLASSESSLTATGMFVGTIDYVAPEQLEGRPLDARADVYSLGCMLYHALTGSVPYPQETQLAKMYAHAHEPPPAASRLVPGLPPRLDGVLACAMAKRPEERYSSAGDFARAVHAALAAPVRTQPRLPPPPAAPVPPPDSPETEGGPSRRSRRSAAIVAAVVAGVAAAAVGVLAATGAFSGGHKTAGPTPGGGVGTSTESGTTAPSGGTAAGPPIAGNTLTIYSSFPLQGAARSPAVAAENGAKIALENAQGRVGRYTVRYRQLDDSTAASGAADEGKTAANARQAAGDRSAVGYIGEFNSGASKVSIPILNSAGIAQVSPSNTEVGLTTNGPGAEAGEPEKYYPTGRRTYARVAANDTVQAKALGRAADEAGCVTMRIWNSGTVYSVGLAKSLEQSAAAVSIDVEGDDSIDPRAPNYRSLARKIGADCFVFTGEAESNGAQAVSDAGSAPTVKKIFTSDGMCYGGAVRGLPAAVTRRMKCTTGGLAPAAYGAAGRAFFDDYSRRFGGGLPNTFAIYGYESMALLLDSIKRAGDGASGDVSRAGVVNALFATKDRNSVLGTYSINPNGDTSLTDYGLNSFAGRQLVFDHVLKP